MAEQSSWVPLPCCSLPGHPFPIEFLALSTCMSLWTNHFQVLDKNQLSVAERSSPPCNRVSGLESNQFSSVAQSYPTLCNPMDCSTSGFPVYHRLPEPTQTHVHQVCDDTQPSHSLLSPFPSVFPSIRVFSSELVLHIRCPKYWSFSFITSPSDEYLGLISFKIDWFDLLVVQGILKSLL